MRKHEIPRKKKSETRLFLIFSIMSLATTAIGAAVGLVIALTFRLPGVFIWVTIGFSALIGFLVGTVPVFYIPIIPATKDVQGLYLHQVVMLYIKYKARRSLKVLRRGGSDE